MVKFKKRKNPFGSTPQSSIDQSSEVPKDKDVVKDNNDSEGREVR
jgi:hypothetical protein